MPKKAKQRPYTVGGGPHEVHVFSDEYEFTIHKMVRPSLNTSAVRLDYDEALRVYKELGEWLGIPLRTVLGTVTIKKTKSVCLAAQVMPKQRSSVDYAYDPRI